MTLYYVQDNHTCFNGAATAEMLRRNIFAADIARHDTEIETNSRLRFGNTNVFVTRIMAIRLRMIKPGDILRMKDYQTNIIYEGLVKAPASFKLVYCLGEHQDGQFYSTKAVRDARKKKWHCPGKKSPSIEVQVPVEWKKISSSPELVKKCQQNATIIPEKP